MKPIMQKVCDNVTADFVHKVINRKQVRLAMKTELKHLCHPAIRKHMERQYDYSTVCR